MDTLEFDFTQADHYLLDWGTSIAAKLSLTPVTVEEDQDSWITFRYVSGDHADCLGGAEKHKILTRVEAMEALRALGDLQRARESAKALTDGGKARKRAFLMGLRHPDRDLFQEAVVDAP